MVQVNKTGFQKWCFRRKLDALYYGASIQLALFNAYLYLRYIVKYHRRPKKISQEEAERVVKELFTEYKETKLP